MSNQPKPSDTPLPKPEAGGQAEEPTSEPPPAAAAPAAGSGDAGPLNVEPDSQLDPRNEEDLWEGRASWKSIYPSLLLWLLITLDDGSRRNTSVFNELCNRHSSAPQQQIDDPPCR